MKILYIPAENVRAKVSRSYFVAKGFSTNNEVYKVFWYDNRNRFWEGKPPSVIYTVSCFFKSLFTSIKVKKSNDFGYDVYGSIFINAFIGKVLGKYSALKMMRSYNLKTLKKMVDKINPDIIYHADGFYFFPALKESIPEFSDLQDDVNWKNIPQQNIQEESAYYSTQFNSTVLNFIVSKNAATSFNKKVNCKFITFDNGADFKALCGFSDTELEEIKSRFSIPKNKTLISYIGGAHKFDEKFTFRLVQECLTKIPNAQFLLVGNLPKIASENVTNIGFLSTDDANKIYSISDIGITLKNTDNDPFLYSSVPLKFIQYGATQKPIITFPVEWSENNKFKNIFHVKGENLDDWIETIKQVSTNFKWDNELDKVWSLYDWQTIADDVLLKINTPLSK